MQSTVSLTPSIHYEDGNPARAYIKQALGSFKDGDGDGDTHYERSHKGVKASANSDIIFFFTSAQDGNRLLDDERLCLDDDLKKAHDQNQNKSKLRRRDEFAGMQKYLDEMIEQRSDGTMYYLDRIWVPLKGEVRTLIMDEAHKSKYSIHPGVDKMYYDLRDRLRLSIKGHLACSSNMRFPYGNRKG
ncbi:hypothetical protein Tco_1025073 [Tanacetum coccineum]